MSMRMNFEGECKDVDKLGFLDKVTDISPLFNVYKKKLPRFSSRPC